MIEELADTDDSFHSSLVSELLQNLRREASSEAYRALSTEINHLTETADGYRTVSYTHLDVYKRQYVGSERCPDLLGVKGA